MKSVETAYKVTKIKTALKIHGSTDPTVKLVKNWDENSASKGRHSVGRCSEVCQGVWSRSGPN